MIWILILTIQWKYGWYLEKTNTFFSFQATNSVKLSYYLKGLIKHRHGHRTRQPYKANCAKKLSSKWEEKLFILSLQGLGAFEFQSFCNRKMIKLLLQKIHNAVLIIHDNYFKYSELWKMICICLLRIFKSLV